MTDPGPFRSADFWIAVGVALIVKIKTSASLGPVKVITSMIVAAGAAWVASDYAAETFGVPLPIAAAVVTLTAEGAMRWLLIAVNDPKQAIDLWRYWRK
ncbi:MULTISPECIES: hypothetical protein [Paracoccus]|uniref:hypothetical protein n=1 Tax=Paracoccus TaxID=265 RepID=UPI001E3E6BBD|nr:MULTISPECIES: hypothetical protein [Paracoccus]MDK8871480.1 hypothetical protein [Paracoccus sp. SSJ]UFS66547.1 hypothetical protein LO749_18745 [Paracoccus denitrificans]